MNWEETFREGETREDEGGGLDWRGLGRWVRLERIREVG